MISFLRVGQMSAAPNCDYMESGCCTFQVNVFVPLQAAGSWAELPEGVSEVHTPSLQLLWVVGRHVGELSEDVEVRGVSW